MTELFLKLLDMSITTGWLVLTVMLLRFLLRKTPKWVFPALWYFVGIRLLLPKTFECSLSLIPNTTRVGATVQTVTSSGSHGLAAAMSVMWCAGVVVMLLYGAVSFIRLRSKLKTAVRLSENIYQSEYVKSPFIVGLVSPRIYLPFHMDKQNFDSVIAHERAHIKRRDHWLKPIAFLFLSVYWFNPLIWIAYLLLCRDIELACDERVIKNMDDSQRIAYSQALLSCTVNRRSIAVCPLAFGNKDVKKRVRSVLNYRKPSKYIIGTVVAVFLIFGICFLTNPKNSETAPPSISQQDPVDDHTSPAESESQQYNSNTRHIIVAVRENLNREICELNDIYQNVYGK